MDKKLKELLGLIEAKKKEAQAFVTKADPSADDVSAANKLIEEIKGLQAQAGAIQAAMSGLGEADDFLAKAAKELNEPSERSKATTAQILGAQPAGEAVIEKDRKGSVLYQDGDGLLTQKQIDAISSKGYKDAFNKLMRAKGNVHTLGPTDLKALSEGIDEDGGFLVPEDMLARIIQKDPAIVNLVDDVTQLNTGRDALTMPKVVYTTDDKYSTGMRVTRTGEIPASSTAHAVTDPDFGVLRIPVDTFMMSLPIYKDLIEDAQFPLQSWIAGKFAETVRLLKGDKIVNGSGIGEPAGILMNPGGTHEPAVVNLGNPITTDGTSLVALAYAVPEQYDANCKYYFNKTNVGSYIAQLKDGQNRPLFTNGMADAGLASARPRQLLGYPVAFEPFMPDRAANAFPIIFGDARGYFMVNRIAFSIQFYDDSAQAALNRILAIGRVRFGGKVAEPWRLKIGKQA